MPLEVNCTGSPSLVEEKQMKDIITTTTASEAKSDCINLMVWSHDVDLLWEPTQYEAACARGNFGSQSTHSELHLLEDACGGFIS